MSLLAISNRGVMAPRTAPWILGDEFDRMFQGFGRGTARSEEGFLPALDVRETDDSYVVEADIPGMKKEDVKIEIAENVLSITGERTNKSEEKLKDYHRVERSFGSFRRTVSIPGGFSHNDVKATFEDGVLKVTLPKPEEAKPRKIEVSE